MHTNFPHFVPDYEPEAVDNVYVTGSRNFVINRIFKLAGIVEHAALKGERDGILERCIFIQV